MYWPDVLLGNIFSLIEHANSSDPLFTFGELAFPALNLAPQNDSMSTLLEKKNLTISVSVELPALRADLKCTIVPQNKISITTNDPAPLGTLSHSDDASFNRRGAFVNVRTTLPPGCHPNATSPTPPNSSAKSIHLRARLQTQCMEAQ